MRRLIVTVDAVGVRALSGRRHRVVVAKACADTNPSVVWIAVPPSVLITIAWSETYGLFAAAVPSRGGSSIDVVASLYPARDRSTYAFKDGAFGEPTTDRRIPKNHYDVQNATPDASAFGLLQALHVSGRHALFPVNLVVLPASAGADFAPDGDVFVWSDAAATSGAVVSHVPARALLIAYPLGTSTQRCRYDVEADAFLLESEVHDGDDLL